MIAWFVPLAGVSSTETPVAGLKPTTHGDEPPGVMMASHHRGRQTDAPPVAGMSTEVWAWLRALPVVRPDAVAEAKARIAEGRHPSATELADALLHAV